MLSNSNKVPTGLLVAMEFITISIPEQSCELTIQHCFKFSVKFFPVEIFRLIVVLRHKYA